MTASNFLWNPGTSNNGLTTTAFSLQTTELNSLTTGSYVVSSVNGSSGVFSNTSGAQAIWSEFFLTLGAIGTALSAGANIAGWFLKSYDGGTTFEQTSSSPPRAPDFIIPLPAATISAATVWGGSGLVLVPALKYKVGLQNNTGQTLASSGNTLRAAPVNMQGV
jgi:hypothetical protein